MFAYRHRFHAGNFADVFKHLLLVQLLGGLARKPAPFCVLDTHAGLGRYELSHAWTLKHREYEQGIARLWARGDIPAGAATYLDLVRAENPDGALRAYPGSPQIVRALTRPVDRIVLCELNREDHSALRAAMAGDRRVGVHLQDGFLAVKAHLPPRERRGLTFIDPAFDRKGEYRRVRDALATAQARFATGVLACWYPLMRPEAVHKFERDVIATGIRRILQAELWVHPPDWTHDLRGCGMLLVNPPWGVEAVLRSLLPWLVDVLSSGPGAGQRLRWLVPE